VQSMDRNYDLHRMTESPSFKGLPRDSRFPWGCPAGFYRRVSASTTVFAPRGSVRRGAIRSARYRTFWVAAVAP
jgi:hypothetical protein